MASVKILLWKHDQKPDGRFPIAIRITKNRKSRYIFTEQYVFENEWDSKNLKVKKSHPNSTRLNNLLLKKLSEAQSAILDSEANDDNASSKQIKKKIKRSGRNTSFFQVAAERIEKKHLAGTYSVSQSELSILFNIKEFLDLNKKAPVLLVKTQIKQRRKERISKGRKGELTPLGQIRKFSTDKSLIFSDITTAFLDNFKSFCTIYLDQKTRTITNQLIFIRTLYNVAIKDGIIHEKFYPFAGEKEKITLSSSNKIGLNREEITKIENLELEPQSSIWHTRNVYLFSYYFAGVRISDVLELKWYSFMDGRLYYEMNKNEKPVSIKIPEKAKVILSLYEQDKQGVDDYVFPFLKKANQASPEDIFRKTRNATKLLNKYLKRIAVMCEIDKNLSNHIARHTFGNLAGDKINPIMLQKLYRHSDLKTTIGYQANFIHKEADDALDMVLGD
ncbi:tyrosine-type recombinase/integrase [Kordia sp. TARA_039_SRF]|nr:tyrosine-type recombinase/integrase [Kordia sp. TARA_039_SRF]